MVGLSEETYCVAVAAATAVAPVVVDLPTTNAPAVVVARYAGVADATTAVDEAAPVDVDAVIDDAIEEGTLVLMDAAVADVTPVAELDAFEVAESVEPSFGPVEIGRAGKQ